MTNDVMQPYVYNKDSQIMVSFDNAQVRSLPVVRHFINVSFNSHSPIKDISYSGPESEVSLCGRLVVTTITFYSAPSVRQFSIEQL